MPKKLRVGPACYHVLHVIPPTVAHEMGFFFQEGLHDDDGELTYELVRDSYAPFMFEQIALGQTMKERGIDVSMDVKPSTVAYLRQQGYDLRIIAGWRNQQPHHVLGKADIRSLRDLRGKRVGVIDHDDILVTVLSYWLKEYGLEPKQDVEWVRGFDPRRTPAALRDGRLDAGFVDDTDQPTMLAEGYNLLLDIRSKYPKGRPDRIIAATGKAIEEKPQQVKAFMKGMLRAYWFLRKQPENTAFVQAIEARLRRESPDPDEPKRNLQFASPVHAEMMPFPFDGLPSGLEAYLEEAVALGILDKYSPPEELCSLDLTKAAFAELEQRQDVQGDLARAKEVAARLGY
ncbi:MAG: ABC transporter substrate-binding protein [Chloroflexi bacterium]|nr:ABC transporter substrate-binding protein [Chloroflexota bacterium]